MIAIIDGIQSQDSDKAGRKEHKKGYADALKDFKKVEGETEEKYFTRRMHGELKLAKIKLYMPCFQTKEH